MQQDINLSSSEPTLRYQLIDDAPTSVDHLHGLAHDKVAEGITRLIDESDSGFAIGIQGAWGAGKSSVARMAAKKLSSSNNKYHVFHFDAWAHQSDPIRRSFLINLIDSVRGSEFFDENYQSETRERLASKKRVISWRERSQPTGLAVFVYFVVALLPISYLWLSPFAFQDSTPSSWVSLYGPVAVLGAYILFPLIYALSRWRNSETNRSAGTPHPFFSSFSFIERASSRRTREEWMTDPDPSADELMEILARIAKELEEVKKRLIVVYDNIDRLPAGRLRETWSNLRNLFESDDDSRSGDLRNVYLIVPYDEDHVATVFSIDEMGDKGEQLDSENKAKSRAITGFVEKTFRVVFPVPPPFLSDSSEYLRGLLVSSVGEALEDHDIEDVVSIFEATIAQGESEYAAQQGGVTPRKMKRFVNDFAISYALWNPRIPSQDIALFVALKQNIRENINALLSLDYPSERVVAQMKNEFWVDSLVSMWYGVDPDNATEILLKEPIRLALINGQAERLKEFARKRGFKAALENALHSIDIGDNSFRGQYVKGVAHALKAEDIKEVLDAEKIWNAVAVRIWSQRETAKPALSFDKIEVTGIVNIIEEASESWAEKIADHALNHVVPFGEEDSKEAYAKNFYSSVMEVVSTLINRGLRDRSAQETRINVEVDAQVEGDVVREIARVDVDSVDYFQFDSDANKVLSRAMAHRRGDIGLSWELGCAIADVAWKIGDVAWEEAQEIACERLSEAYEKEQIFEVAWYLGWVYVIRRKGGEQINEEAVVKLQENNVLGRLFAENDEDKAEIGPKLLWLLFLAGADEKIKEPPRRAQSSGNPPREQWEIDLEKEIASWFEGGARVGRESVLDAVESARDGRVVMERVVSEPKNIHLWKDLLGEVVQRPQLFGLSARLIFSRLENLLSLDFDNQFWTNIASAVRNEEHDLVRAMEGRGVESLGLGVKAMRVLAKAGGETFREVSAKWTEYFEGIDGEGVRKAIYGDGLEGIALSVLEEHEIKGRPPSVGVEITKSEFENMITVEADESLERIARWRSVVERMTPASRRKVYEFAWLSLSSKSWSGEGVRVGLRGLTSKTAVDAMCNVGGEEENFWERVVCTLLEEQHQEGVAWVNDHADSLIGMIESAGRTVKERLAQVLGEVRLDEGDTREGIEALRKAVGRQRPKK